MSTKSLQGINEEPYPGGSPKTIILHRFILIPNGMLLVAAPRNPPSVPQGGSAPRSHSRPTHDFRLQLFVAVLFYYILCYAMLCYPILIYCSFYFVFNVYNSYTYDSIYNIYIYIYISEVGCVIPKVSPTGKLTLPLPCVKCRA